MGDDERRRPSGPDGTGRAPEPVPVPSPWGDVVIPDDLSELADEAADVRRQLRAARRRERWSRALGFTDDVGGPGVSGPLFIVVLAMAVALISLFGGFWPYQADSRETRSVTGGSAGRQVPPLTLTDASGDLVRLNQVRPAVILAVGRCSCDRLIAETAALTNQAGITLLVVAQPTAPTLAPVVEGTDPDAVRGLADPHGELFEAVAPGRSPGSDVAIAVLVSAEGLMTQVISDVRSVEEFSDGIDRLT